MGGHYLHLNSQDHTNAGSVLDLNITEITVVWLVDVDCKGPRQETCASKFHKPALKFFLKEHLLKVRILFPNLTLGYILHCHKPTRRALSKPQTEGWKIPFPHSEPVVIITV